MEPTSTISRSEPTNHTDSINCIAYDYYGHKLVTCSTDTTVRIYERDKRLEDEDDDDDDCEEVLGWTEISCIQHEKPVWAASWAHPECGTQLALTGFEGPVIIYCQDSKQWNEIQQINDAKEPVTYIEFAPPQFNYYLEQRCNKSENIGVPEKSIKLCLATLSQDGKCRFYATSAQKGESAGGKAVSDKAQLEHWPDWDINIGESNNLRTLSWSRSWNSEQEPLLAIGCGDAKMGNCLKLYYLNTWHSSDSGNSTVQISGQQSGQNLGISGQIIGQNIGPNSGQVSNQHSSSNLNGSHDGDDQSIWKWKEVVIPNNVLDKVLTKIKSPIHDVCFANTSGRSYHLLAIASDNGTKLIKISQYDTSLKKLDKPIVSNIRLEDTSRWKTFKSDANTQSTMVDVSSRQVSFNSNGTVLTSVTSSGEILVYQYEPHGTRVKGASERWIGVHREEIN